MAEKLITKNDLLNKLRAYRTTPDDDVILYKQKLRMPCYQIHVYYMLSMMQN